MKWERRCRSDSKYSNCTGWSRCRTLDEGSWKSGDGSIADESGEDNESIIKKIQRYRDDRDICVVSLFLYINTVEI